MPLFAHLFGIREWEMDLMTHRGYLQYKKFADDWLKGKMRGGD